MFTKTQTKAKLEKEINSALDELSQTPVKSQEYDAVIDRIARLQKLKAEQASKLPSPDTMLIVGANLLGIAWLTNYERENPITSKALNFVMRPK